MSHAVTLGDFLAFNRRSSADLRAWLQAHDRVLVDRLANEAEARGETIAQFLRIAAADFMAEADEQNWTSLISALREGADPGAVCVERVMDFRIRIEHSRRGS